MAKPSCVHPSWPLRGLRGPSAAGACVPWPDKRRRRYATGVASARGFAGHAVWGHSKSSTAL